MTSPVTSQALPVADLDDVLACMAPDPWRPPLVMQIPDDVVPHGLRLEPDASAGFTTLQRADQPTDDQPPTPELVAYFTDPPTRRNIMVSSIASADPGSLLLAMAGHWPEWPRPGPEHRSYRRMDHDGGDTDRSRNLSCQIAWAEAGCVVWIVAMGIQGPELERFVDGVVDGPT